MAREEYPSKIMTSVDRHKRSDMSSAKSILNRCVTLAIALYKSLGSNLCSLVCPLEDCLTMRLVEKWADGAAWTTA
jgi:hypothetical protein